MIIFAPPNKHYLNEKIYYSNYVFIIYASRMF